MKNGTGFTQPQCTLLMFLAVLQVLQVFFDNYSFTCSTDLPGAGTASALVLPLLPKIPIAYNTVYGVCKTCTSVWSLTKTVNTLLLSVGWQHTLWPCCSCFGSSKIIWQWSKLVIKKKKTNQIHCLDLLFKFWLLFSNTHWNVDQWVSPRCTISSNKLESPLTSPAHELVQCAWGRHSHLQTAASCAFPKVCQVTLWVNVV